MNPKEFLSRWIEGMKNITPVQQLQMKVSAHFGGTIGLILAMITLMMYNTYHFTVFLIFMIVLQYLEWIGARQQYIQALEMEQYIKQQGDLNEVQHKESI